MRCGLEPSLLGSEKEGICPHLKIRLLHVGSLERGKAVWCLHLLAGVASGQAPGPTRLLCVLPTLSLELSLEQSERLPSNQ